MTERRYRLEVEYPTKTDKNPSLSADDLIAEVYLVLNKVLDERAERVVVRIYAEVVGLGN